MPNDDGQQNGGTKDITLKDIVVHMQSMGQRLSGDMKKMERRLNIRIDTLEERLTTRIDALDEDLTATMQDGLKIRKHVGMAVDED